MGRKKAEVECGEHDQYRSNMVAFVPVLKNLKENGFGDEHIELLKTTPFWPLFKAYNDGLVTEMYYKKYDANIIRIIQCFDEGTRKFKFGNNYAELTSNHISDILGIPATGSEIKLNKRGIPDSAFIHTYFNTKKQLTKTDVEAALDKAIKGNSERHVRDVVRLIALHFCLTLFFANTGNSLGWFLTGYISELSKIGSYNWASAVHEWLMHSIMKKLSTPSTVTGCVPVLLFWLCEISNILPPIPELKNHQPRFLRWNLPALTSRLEKIKINTIQLKSTCSKGSIQTRSTKRPRQHSNEHIGSNDDFIVSFSKKPAGKGKMVSTGSSSDYSLVDVPFNLSTSPTPPEQLVPTNQPNTTQKLPNIQLPDEHKDATLKKMEFEERELGGTPLQILEYVECLEYEEKELTLKLKEAWRIIETKEIDLEKEKQNSSNLQKALDDETAKTSNLHQRLEEEKSTSSNIKKQLDILTTEKQKIEAELGEAHMGEAFLRVYATAREDEVQKLKTQLLDALTVIGSKKEQIIKKEE